MRLQEALHQCRRTGAVHVVVAEHGHGLAAHDGIGEPGGALVHIRDDARIGHQRFDRGIEHQLHLVELNAARGQNPAKQFRQAVLLADGDRRVAACRIEPLAPGKAAGRIADAEKELLLYRVIGLEPRQCHTPPACETNAGS
jgi:hypothetical protein